MTGVEALLLQARLAWNGDEAEQGMNSAGKTASSLQSKISGAMKKIGVAIAAAFTVDAIKNFVVAAIDAGAEVSAEVSAFEQIMGDYTDEANQKMNSIADNTGMVASRLTPYMTSMTAKFKGLGYGIEDATDLAARGLNLAADGAAFWDMSLDESTSHLNSFINGSYEGGEAIGLFANDTQMAMFAVEQGLIKNTKAWANLDEATKQATRLEYAENMYAQSGATGQAAKESEQYANVVANLAEKWRQFQAQIGEPIIQNIAIPVLQKLGDIIDVVSGAFDGLGTIWQYRIQPRVNALGASFRKLISAITGMLPDLELNEAEWNKLKITLLQFVEGALEKVSEGIDKLAEILPSLAPYIAAAAAAFAGFKVGSAIQNVVRGFQEARLAVSLFTAGQNSSAIATGLASGALKAHEIIVGLLTGKITLAQVATGIWTKVQAGLNAVMSANPIALVVMAIAAIVAALVLAYQKSDTFRAFVDQLWASLKEKLEPVIQSVSNFITGTLVPAFQAVGDWITTAVVPALQQLGSWLQEHILAAFQAVSGWITGTLVPTFQAWGDYIMTNIVPALQDLGAAIQERVQPILAAISDFISGTVVPAFQKIIDIIQQILTAAAPYLEALKIAFTTAFTVIKVVAETIWNHIKIVIETVLGVIKGIIQAVTAAIRGDWSGAWNAIKGIALTVWNGIKSAVSNAINGVMSIITTVLNGIKGYWSNIWAAIKNVALVIWNNLSSSVRDKITSMAETISDKVDSIKEWLSFSGLVSKVKTIFGDIKDSITEKIEDARDTVKDIVDKIVGFFTGAKFTWPSIPMPHFSISPSGWQIGDLLKGSIPSLGITWYAKAMDDAMVLDGATIFGAAGDQMLGGGEAGREVVSGEAHLIDLIGQAVARNNAAMLAALYKILDAIHVLNEGLYDQIVEALTDGVRFEMDGREFGRLVKSYA